MCRVALSVIVEMQIIILYCVRRNLISDAQRLEQQDDFEQY